MVYVGLHHLEDCAEQLLLACGNVDSGHGVGKGRVDA